MSNVLDANIVYAFVQCEGQFDPIECSVLDVQTGKEV